MSFKSVRIISLLGVISIQTKSPPHSGATYEFTKVRSCTLYLENMLCSVLLETLCYQGTLAGDFVLSGNPGFEPLKYSFVNHPHSLTNIRHKAILENAFSSTHESLLTDYNCGETTPESTTISGARPIDGNSTCESPPSEAECQNLDIIQVASSLWCTYDNSSHSSNHHRIRACADICQIQDAKCEDSCRSKFILRLIIPSTCIVTFSEKLSISKALNHIHVFKKITHYSWKVLIFSSISRGNYDHCQVQRTRQLCFL